MARTFFRTLARHQVGSLAATVVDFLTMIGLASGAGVPPWVATAIGAACGGAMNFFLGRMWIFHLGPTKIHVQALRYVFASGVGMCLNAAGVYLLSSGWAHVGYVAARTAVALVVSLVWSFPVHRHFVFAHDSCFGTRS